jgi:hypothetical protein
MSTDPFRQAKERFSLQKGQLATGHITREQFDAALKQLMIRDAQGRYLLLNLNSGQWHVYDERQWVPASPPTAQATVLPERGGTTSPGSLPERLPTLPRQMLPNLTTALRAASGR